MSSVIIMAAAQQQLQRQMRGGYSGGKPPEGWDWAAIIVGAAFVVIVTVFTLVMCLK